MTQDPIVAALLNLTSSGGEWVLWLLLVLSVWATAIIIERVLAHRSMLGPLTAAIDQVRAAVRVGRPGDDWQAPDAPGLDGVFVFLAAGGDIASAEARIEAIAGDLRRALLKRTPVLGTLGANTPFIGLLGTVLGIIQAFRDLAAADQGSAATAVIAGIAEALVATGLGLAVAIPCVIAYNIFVGRTQRVVARFTETARWLAAARQGG